MAVMAVMVVMVVGDGADKYKLLPAAKYSITHS